jgi:hypothetical protein
MVRTTSLGTRLTLLALLLAGSGCSGKGDPGSTPSAGGAAGSLGAAGGALNAGGSPGAAAGGVAANGGLVASGGSAAVAGTGGSGGPTASGGATSSGGAIGTGGTAAVCDAPGLVWKTGAKTNFTSYPAPGSVECVQYSGCLYEGQFAACPNTEPLAWVQAHNIVSVFPDLATLKLHDLCLKSGSSTIVVTALDTCADTDCSGCCTQNKGSADELIDVESFTDARWGVPDGPIQWADLGPTKGSGCK